MYKLQNRRISGALGFLFLLVGCYSSNMVSVQNLSSQYQSEYQYLHPEFSVYNKNDSTSDINYKINLSELLYVRRDAPDSFSARVNIHCQITASFESTAVLDSASITLNFPSITNTQKSIAYGSFPVHLRAGYNYLLTITTTDLMSKKEDVSYLSVNKSSPYSAENFLVKVMPSGTPLMSVYSDTAVVLSIRYNRSAARLFVNYYRRNFPLAAPPFSQYELQPFQYKSDSTFVIYPDSSGSFRVTLPPTGFYHIQSDTSTHEGLTVYRFPPCFPAVGEAFEMVPPLRFITSSQEYSIMTDATNVKKAVDAFWLNIANSNEDRARELIRIFYNRVEDANRYFTSYLEGWKTDRGMIFLIFGPPSVVYRSSNSETWTYGEDKNFMSITFTFVKTNNPFTSNDYSLQRSPQLRNIWYNSVDIWRQGKVY